MPRRRPRAAPAPAEPPQLPSVLIAVPAQAPSQRKVRELLNVNRSASDNMDEIRSALGGTMQDAYQNHSVHKKAFGWIKQMDKMSAEKLHDLMGHFLYYYNVSGLKQRAESAPRMPEPAAETATEDAEAEAPPRAAATTGFPAQPSAQTH
jgi:phosphatidylserine/phosphatidylglycerophosphate/cardiolipin synthase-like enzyme